MSRRQRWKKRGQEAERDIIALSFACRDPRVPWYAKAAAAAVVAYALSPIDLIPDFLPVLGYVDDLVVLPLGVLLVRRLVPAPLLAEHRAAADAALPSGRWRWAAAVVILALWGGIAAAAVFVLR